MALREVPQAEREAFVQQVLPWAQEGSRRTGIPVSVVLAQWSLESHYGTSMLTGYNNLAGIKYGSKYGNQDGKVAAAPDGSGPYGAYASLDRFTNHWAAILESEKGYEVVRQAVAAGASVESVAAALGVSPWAGSHYVRNGVPGQGLLDVIALDNLRQFDSPDWGTEGWSFGGWAVTPDTPAASGAITIQVPTEYRGLPWPAVAVIVGVLGLSVIAGSKKA